MERSSSSSIAPAVAILAILFICCSVPLSEVRPRLPRFAPPSPQGAPSTGCVGDCHHGQTEMTPPAMAASALTPHRKTIQQAVTN
ncbi:unnamed protein product [Alopecurus aequalis]